MALLSALLDVIVPVLVVAGVGAILGRRFRIDSGVISKISLNALTPALAFQTLLTTRVSGRVGLQLVAAFTVATILAAGLGWLVTPGVPGHTRRSVMVATAIGNNGNMGLPIALFALGQAGFEQSVLIFIASVIITFIIAPLLYGAHEGPAGALRGMVRLPALWAMALAIAIRASGLHLPLGVSRGVELLASATLPMVLLALGIQLGSSGRIALSRPVVSASLTRVFLIPLLALGIGLAFGLHGLPLQAIVLAMAMPTAVNAFLLAHEYRGDVRTVADTVTVSTLLSFASAAVVTALLPAIGRV